MRSVELVIDWKVGNAKIGVVEDQLNKIKLQTGFLVPYISGSEDIDVVLSNPKILPENVPVEICGVKSAVIRDKIIAIGEKLEIGEGIGYTKFTKRNPPLMSFPPELTWLPRDTGLNYWRKTLETFLPSIGLDRKASKELADKFIIAARKSRENYEFWRIVSNNSYEGQKLSKILLELNITLATRMRCNYMAGLNPIIDGKVDGSIILNHRVNIAYATLVNEMLENGIDAPHYFYTIPLNSTVIQPDDGLNELTEIVKLCRAAFETTDLFSGIHVAIRNLDLISKDPGRVRVVFKLFNDLAQISQDYKVPLWFSRLSLIGLAALDEGADFASYSLNLGLNDVLIDGGLKDEKDRFSKILHKDRKELWNIHQLKKALELGYGLPALKRVAFRNYPDSVELTSPNYYRRLFSKPYNIAAMTDLSIEWRENIKNGEVKPGRQYLQDFQIPFNAWGI